MTAAVYPNTAANMAGLDDVPLPDSVVYDVGYDDMMKLTPAGTPVPGQDMEPAYRCPVSTPANFIHPSPRVRRTKPMPVSLEISLTPQSPGKRSAGGKPRRPGAAGPHRNHQQQGKFPGSGVGSGKRVGGGGTDSSVMGRSVIGSGRPNPGLTPLAGPTGTLNSRTLDYYYVDKAEEKREAAVTNTLWLKALCSQPVHEILDKYRRRSDFRRNRMIWAKTYTTPGERSLLQAWERNAPRVLDPTVRCYLASAHTQCMGPTGSKDNSHQSVGSPRRFQSDTFHRSLGYPSDDGEDDSEEGEGEEEEEEQSQVTGSSVVSGDVTVSTPSYSRRKPRSQDPSSSSSSSSSNGEGEQERRMGHQRQSWLSAARFEAMPDQSNSVPAANSACDVSDHFQISLPSVTEHRPGRITRPRPAGALTRDRRKWHHDVRRQEMMTTELSDSSPRESLGHSKEAPSSPSTLPDTPRSLIQHATIFPAIGKA